MTNATGLKAVMPEHPAPVSENNVVQHDEQIEEEEEIDSGSEVCSGNFSFIDQFMT